MSFVNIVKYIKTTFFLGFYLFPQSMAWANDFQSELDFLKDWSRSKSERIETQKAQDLDKEDLQLLGSIKEKIPQQETELEDSLSFKQAAPKRPSETTRDQQHQAPLNEDTPEFKRGESARRIRSR